MDFNLLKSAPGYGPGAGDLISVNWTTGCLHDSPAPATDSTVIWALIQHLAEREREWAN